MNRFLNHLAASMLCTMLIVLTPSAQDAEMPPPTPRPGADNVTVTIEKVEKELSSIKKPSRRSRTSTSKTTYDDIVMVGGTPVAIKLGESARDVVVVGSDVQVDGTVQGSLVVVLGNVSLGPTGRVVQGPVIVGGDLFAQPGSKIGNNPTVISLSLFGGVTNVLNPALVEAGKRWVAEGAFRIRPLPHRLALAWVVAGFLLLFFVVIGVIFQRPVTASVAILDEKPGSALLVGLLVGFLSLLLVLLLIVSLVGVIVLPFAASALVALFIIGKVAVYRYAGQTLGGQLGVTFLQSPLVALVSGTLLFYLCYAVPVIGAIVWLLVAPLGIGAVVLATLGRNKSAVNAAALGGVAVTDLPSGLAAAPPVLLPRVGFWSRFLATFLDLMLVGLLMALFFHRPEWFLLVWTLYHLALWSWKGTTVGGIILGLRIVRLDGGPIGLPVAAIRLLGGFFSAAVFFLGFFWAGWTQERQAWHDKIAGTVVVRYPKSTPLL